MANIRFGNADDPILISAPGDTYLGGGGNDTYIIDSAFVQSGDQINIADSGSGNIIRLTDGLSIASSMIANNALLLTLSNGATIFIDSAADFDFEVEGDIPGNGGVLKSFAEFVETDLGAIVPGVGEPPVSGIDDRVIGATTNIHFDADNATFYQGIDGVEETFIYEIDSSTFIVESREIADISLQGFNVTEDKLVFRDVSNGTTSDATFTEDALINSGVDAQVVFEDVIINNDNIVVAEEGFSLTLLGIADFATVDFAVV